MTPHLLPAIVLVASLVIVVRSEPALNRMSHCTPFMIRVSFHFLTVGALADIVFILAGEVPSWPTAITSVGVAVLLFCERRLRLLCPLPRRRLP